MNKWRQASIQVMESVLKNSLLPWNEKIIKIDCAYPFGERKYYPYKEWLKVRHIAIVAIERKETNLLAIPKSLYDFYIKKCITCEMPFKTLKKTGKNLPKRCSPCQMLLDMRTQQVQMQWLPIEDLNKK